MARFLQAIAFSDAGASEVRMAISSASFSGDVAGPSARTDDVESKISAKGINVDVSRRAKFMVSVQKSKMSGL